MTISLQKKHGEPWVPVNMPSPGVWAVFETFCIIILVACTLRRLHATPANALTWSRSHLQTAAAVLPHLPAPQIVPPLLAWLGPAGPSCCLLTDTSHWGTCMLCWTLSTHAPARQTTRAHEVNNMHGKHMECRHWDTCTLCLTQAQRVPAARTARVQKSRKYRPTHTCKLARPCAPSMLLLHTQCFPCSQLATSPATLCQRGSR